MKELKKLPREHPNLIKEKKKKIAISAKFIQDIKKLHLEEKDIVLIKFDEKISKDNRQRILYEFGKLPDVEGHFILGCDNKIDLDKISEDYLNEKGWFKKTLTWKQLAEIKKKHNFKNDYIGSLFYMSPFLVAKKFKTDENQLLENKQLITLNKLGLL